MVFNDVFFGFQTVIFPFEMMVTSPDRRNRSQLASDTPGCRLRTSHCGIESKTWGLWHVKHGEYHGDTHIYIYLYRSMYTFVHMYMYLYMFMDMHIACASILSTGGTSQPTIQGNTQTNVVTNQQCNGNTNLEDMIWGHNTDCKRITIRGIATNMLEARLRWNGQLLEGCILMLSILCHSRITSVFLVNKKDTAKTATQWVWQLSVWSQYRDNRFWSFVYYGNSIMRDLTDLTNKSAEWQFTNVK
jgi:hypothetical protein